VVMWQPMFSMPVMRTVWRRKSSSRLHTIQHTCTTGWYAAMTLITSVKTST